MHICYFNISVQIFDVEPKGGIAESVAEGVDGGVDVTEAVGKHPDKGWNHVLNQIISFDIRYDHCNSMIIGPWPDENEGGQGQKT